ncbi:uncharacterized protein EI90DRAFT_3076662 [Cantharellus anzutake]|uniref:uncharacterized protein n=1 Tax=Cantharellus anzutake TaxID=1750568 RepID=UPI001908FCE9|nr:uncharacterized protein EI90DRAFT_3076662 [Cantharellus anzutake]KAF8323639.1 hypothetical protein EI90DRAFT_3076662 [Cantharellus anzutake]
MSACSGRAQLFPPALPRPPLHTGKRCHGPRAPCLYACRDPRPGLFHLTLLYHYSGHPHRLHRIGCSDDGNFCLPGKPYTCDGGGCIMKCMNHIAMKLSTLNNSRLIPWST